MVLNKDFEVVREATVYLETINPGYIPMRLIAVEEQAELSFIET